MRRTSLSAIIPVLVLVATTFVVGLGGCGGGSGITGSVDISGVWDYRYIHDTTTEDYVVEFVSSGSGTYQALENGVDIGILSLSGSNVTWLTGDPGDPLTVTAILSSDGKFMQGSVVATVDGSTAGFDATKR